MRQIFNVLILLFVTVIFSGASFGMNNFKKQAKKQVKVRAPEFAGGKGWLNTDKPLSLAALKGKIVLLDFWTYGCINCIHIIPDLKKLEAKYANELVVIGVHSAKFDNEKDTENIRKIILRYGIEHPVINDADFKIWDAYTVKAYPTQILIDPNGYIIGDYVGEGHAVEIEKTVGETIAEFRKKGNLNEQPLKFALERAKVGDLPLAFPGKVLADAQTNRLFIADTNHNRIVITDLNGKLLDVIGSGKAALTDGNYAAAGFNRPQGLFLEGELLYVADTQNHAIRMIDLAKKTVETISGNGKQAAWKSIGGNAKTSELSSPWDLTKVGDALFLAMAGTHQIWKLDLSKNTVAPYAGSGGEARSDGSIKESAFAQPSGIVSDGRNLFVADSESNIIREINTQTEEVETLVGGDLYIFGDEDGEGDDVRLQHPLGVVLYDGKLLIADTYNHKIKLLDVEKRTVETFAGTGKSGQIDGVKATFYEPAGLSIAGGKLFIADTNNQAIRVLDLKTKNVSTLKIEGLTPPIIPENETENVSPNLQEKVTETKTISANSHNSLIFQINLPEGFHLNAAAPNRFEISTTDDKNIKIPLPKQKYNKLPLVVPFQTLQKGDATIKAKLTVFYCREDNTGTCNIKTLAWRIPVKVSADGKGLNKVEVAATIK